MKESDFESRKQYLVALAIEFLRENTGYVGIDDTVFYDEAECDGLCLANDMAEEFELDGMLDY